MQAHHILLDLRKIDHSTHQQALYQKHQKKVNNDYVSLMGYECQQLMRNTNSVKELWLIIGNNLYAYNKNNETLELR